MVYPPPHFLLAKWKQFCLFSGFPSLNNCTSSSCYSRAMYLHLLVVLGPCPTGAVSYFLNAAFQMGHGPSSKHTSAESAMCPAGYIPVCITLQNVCFFLNSRPCWLTLSFHGTALIPCSLQSWCPDSGYSSSDCFCLAVKFCISPSNNFLFDFLISFLQSTKEHFELWFCLLNCLRHSHVVKMWSSSSWAVFSFLCVKTFSWACMITLCSPFP